MALFLAAILVFAASVASAFAMTWWQIERAGRRLSQHAGCMIVVFGAEAIDGQPSAELEARLRFAASLYQAARAPLILCSGGHPGPQSEPRVMRRALVRWGVPESQILIDEEGTSTRKTVVAAKRMATNRGSRALLVSSPYHMYRICSEARRQGLAAVGCPAPTTPVMQHAPTLRRQMLREVAATWWYVAAGRRTIAVEESAVALRRTPRALAEATGGPRIGVAPKPPFSGPSDHVVAVAQKVASGSTPGSPGAA
jgi:uncharacterized SAM-binding protein YcdF (DUF218 family)